MLTGGPALCVWQPPPQVYYNGERLSIKSFQEYVDMYLGPKVREEGDREGEVGARCGMAQWVGRRVGLERRHGRNDVERRRSWDLAGVWRGEVKARNPGGTHAAGRRQQKGKEQRDENVQGSGWARVRTGTAGRPEPGYGMLPHQRACARGSLRTGERRAALLRAHQRPLGGVHQHHGRLLPAGVCTHGGFSRHEGARCRCNGVVWAPLLYRCCTAATWPDAALNHTTRR